MIKLNPSRVKKEFQLKGDYAAKTLKLDIIETNEVMH
jgi:hypothetical protein